jgi:hypothetical protein
MAISPLAHCRADHAIFDLVRRNARALNSGADGVRGKGG